MGEQRFLPGDVSQGGLLVRLSGAISPLSTWLCTKAKGLVWSTPSALRSASGDHLPGSVLKV